MNDTAFTHDFTGDPRAKLHEYITLINEMTRRNDHVMGDRSKRMVVIERLIEEYVAQTGRHPDGKHLERLTDAILYEELTDSHPDKMTRNEYPIMSDTQLARRREGKQVKKDGRNKGEVPLNAAKYFGSDLRNYREPVRKGLSTQEAINVDNKTKSRNKERQRVYREFTKTQPVTTYNMND